VVANQVWASDLGAATRNPAARAAPTFLADTSIRRTPAPIMLSDPSVQLSNTTITSTGTATWAAAAAMLARHRGNRSRSLCAGTTTTISRNGGATPQPQAFSLLMMRSSAR
jgi:hypothetical protein